MLDDISIWSLGLSDIEVTYIVTGADSLLNDNPIILNSVVAFYNFNTGVGDVAIDRSGNQNHANIQGATWMICFQHLERIIRLVLTAQMIL